MLEYNTAVWSPTLKKDITAIEAVQRRFTKRLPGLRNYSYSDRLKSLQLNSLELRRLHFDLILCYQIIFSLVALNSDDYFKIGNVNNTRGHQYKLQKDSSRGVRQHFFSSRIVNIWNYLPSDIIDFITLSSFKRTLQTVDLSRFLKCN